MLLGYQQALLGVVYNAKLLALEIEGRLALSLHHGTVARVKELRRLSRRCIIHPCGVLLETVGVEDAASDEVAGEEEVVLEAIVVADSVCRASGKEGLYAVTLRNLLGNPCPCVHRGAHLVEHSLLGRGRRSVAATRVHLLLCHPPPPAGDSNASQVAPGEEPVHGLIKAHALREDLLPMKLQIGILRILEGLMPGLGPGPP
mmetsp:Transcript_15964/g.34970  ORF Transcript_15964/g.34970 Transcript_15964/m.34970 type:complete len:202 (+) Transcript_15964:518-1123(+)